MKSAVPMYLCVWISVTHLKPTCWNRTWYEVGYKNGITLICGIICLAVGKQRPRHRYCRLKSWWIPDRLRQSISVIVTCNILEGRPHAKLVLNFGGNRRKAVESWCVLAALALPAKSYDRNELRLELTSLLAEVERNTVLFSSVKKGSLCRVSKIISLRVL